MSSLSDSDGNSVLVHDVSVTYRTSLEKRPTLKSTVKRLGRRERIVREVEALKHVSFQVPQGSVLGVIGANGAGKSTLMRAIAGILPPTSGKVEVYGRVSTLLALGVGEIPMMIASLHAASSCPMGFALSSQRYSGGISSAK